MLLPPSFFSYRVYLFAINAMTAGLPSVLCFRLANAAQKYGQLFTSLVPDREQLALIFIKTRSIDCEIVFDDILSNFSVVATALRLSVKVNQSASEEEEGVINSQRFPQVEMACSSQ
jgi:hypothetical protein